MSNRLKFAWLPEETATGDRNAGPAGGLRKFLRAYLAQLRGRRRSLLCIVAGAWAIAAAVILSLPVSYTGVATVMIGVTADRAGEVDATDRMIESEIELIRSRALAESVVRRLGLDGRGNAAPAASEGGIVPAIIDRVTAAPAAAEGLNDSGRPNRSHQVAVSRFLDRLHVARRGHSLVVEIAYRSHSPQTAAAAANAVAEAYVGARAEAYSDPARRFARPAARILSAAGVPLGPSPARTIVALGLALLLSCAGGLAVAGVATGLDRGFRSLQQIEEDTGMPTLGLVPRIAKRGLRGMNPPDYILENPVSAYSESIRSLYTAILLSNVETPPKVLMVASAAPDEGKTSLALSFARMVGRIGQKRVVLVDCDTRHPQVHRKLGLQASPGLVEYLTGEATLEQVLQVDAKTNALVIAAGRKPSNSVELLTSERFADLLSKLSAACDLVILDSSPVLAISDARILARLVDKTIFVARWARTRRELVLRGIKNLTDAGADVAGIALTRVDVRKHARFGFGDSGMYHGAYRRYYSG